VPEILTLQQFTEGIVQIYISTVEEKIGFTFKMFDFNKDGIITREDVQLLLAYSELSLLLIDTNLREGASPKEGKYSSRVNSYLSYMTRISQQREIEDFVNKIFEQNESLS
jgi:Ca2+-binding EF-hand superfamily protein